jgi:hypothetical protein
VLWWKPTLVVAGGERLLDLKKFKMKKIKLKNSRASGGALYPRRHRLAGLLRGGQEKGRTTRGSTPVPMPLVNSPKRSQVLAVAVPKTFPL